MSAPFFSIVVPCRNAAASVDATIESIDRQTETSRELVVIDGASTDGTLDVFDRYRASIGVFVSEPDGGVYAAMNKGARLARGEWLLFLGANDRLATPDVLAHVRAAIAGTEAQVVSCEASYTDGRTWRAPVAPVVRYRNFMHHQSTFYRRQLFERFAYDEELRIQADYDLNLRLWYAAIRPVPLQVRVATCAPGGLSDGGSWSNYREEIAVRHRHLPPWKCWPWDAGSVLRYVRKRLIARRHKQASRPPPGSRQPKKCQ